MSTFRRISATLTAQFNEFLNQVENHEAVAEESIRRFSSQMQEARFRVRVLEREINRYKERIETLATQKVRWQDRARNYAESDREKALACVQRAQRLEKDIAHWQSSLKEMESQRVELCRGLNQVEKRFEEMKRKQKLLSSREARARMIKSFQDGTPVPEDLEGVFDRWELQVMRREAAADSGDICVDSLSENLDSEEEKVELELALDALVEDKDQGQE
ncbi:MAG: PspA/IM30 family protein [Bdellovibrionaceae bacterium]|nr:PspA/IM30 family protein [Bdellovibrionales bacterium]MCB9084513.1 PspA/IM30 family protein [Pseudobdellovibrionaceae bacterium]